MLTLVIADLASSRLQAILNSCLIRRKKDSVLDGKKLIELPLKEVIVRKLTFSQDERDIYDAVGASISYHVYNHTDRDHSDRKTVPSHHQQIPQGWDSFESMSRNSHQLRFTDFGLSPLEL